MLYLIIRFLSALFCRAFFRLEVFGREHIPKKGGFIVASNHASFLDPIAVAVACPRKLNFMARHELFNNPLFSAFIFSLHAFPVKRDSADLSALKDAMTRVKAGKGLLLFPQGSRKIDLFATQGQPGIGFLASKLNVPVIPAFVKGSDIALPAGAKSIKPVKVSVRFGRQISVERGLPYQDITAQIMDSIRHLSC